MTRQNPIKKWVRWGSGLLLLSLGLSGWWAVKHPEYLLGNSATKTIKQAQNATLGQTQVWIFYQPGCRDCRQVAGPLLVNSWQLDWQTDTKVLPVNTKLPANQAVVKQFKITQTPTVIRRHGSQMQRYTGTKPTAIKAVMSGQKWQPEVAK